MYVIKILVSVIFYRTISPVIKQLLMPMVEIRRYDSVRRNISSFKVVQGNDCPYPEHTMVHDRNKNIAKKLSLNNVSRIMSRFCHVTFLTVNIQKSAIF
jgi:hypothetical protein